MKIAFYTCCRRTRMRHLNSCFPTAFMTMLKQPLLGMFTPFCSHKTVVRQTSCHCNSLHWQNRQFSTWICSCRWAWSECWGSGTRRFDSSSGLLLPRFNYDNNYVGLRKSIHLLARCSCLPSQLTRACLGCNTMIFVEILNRFHMNMNHHHSSVFALILLSNLDRLARRW